MVSIGAGVFSRKNIGTTSERDDLRIFILTTFVFTTQRYLYSMPA